MAATGSIVLCMNPHLTETGCARQCWVGIHSTLLQGGQGARVIFFGCPEARALGGVFRVPWVSAEGPGSVLKSLSNNLINYCLKRWIPQMPLGNSEKSQMADPDVSQERTLTRRSPLKTGNPSRTKHEAREPKRTPRRAPKKLCQSMTAEVPKPCFSNSVVFT